jgi:hypothetical protein
MKLTRKVGLIVGAVIIVAALVSLYIVYFRQAEELGDLNERLEDAEALSPGLTATKEELEDQLAQATLLLNKNQAEFPESVESIEYDDDLFEIADDCNVDITRLTASTPKNQKLGTVTYSVSSFTVVVKGTIDDILNFIYAIRTGDDFQLPWSADVTGVSISMNTATISLNIYGYKR